MEYLIKKGESMGILSLKDHLLIWAGFLCFTKFKYDMQMLATVPPARSTFLRTTLFPTGLLLFALLLSLGKQPRQIYVPFHVFKKVSLKWTFHTMLFIKAVSLLSYNCSSCLS